MGVSRRWMGCVLALTVHCCAAAQARAELPMLMRGGQPVVEVMVNGQGPFRFAIDTGAQGQARADAALVARLALPKVGEARGGDSSGKNTVTMDIVRMDSVALGGLEFKAVDAPSRDYNQAGPAREALVPVDGILGLKLFADQLLTLDYKHRKVVIEPGALDAAATDVHRFAAPRGIPVVKLSVAGEVLDAAIDTGNLVAPLLLPADVAARTAFADEPQVVGTARTVSGSFEIKAATLKGNIALGTLVFDGKAVRFPSPGREANLGSLALADKVLTIDQKNGLLRITR